MWLGVTACSRVQGALPVAKHLWSCQAHGSCQEQEPHSGRSLPFQMNANIGKSILAVFFAYVHSLKLTACP